LYVGVPNGADGPRDNRVGDKAECDDKDESPGEDGLHDPTVAGGMYGDGRDPPAEDEEGEAEEGEDADAAVVAD